MDTEAIAWAIDKLEACGIGFKNAYSASMLDRLQRVLFAENAAAPTPPEQEDEPVAVINESDEGKFADLLLEGAFLKMGTKLYTRPDGLRKAAEEALHWLEYMNISSVHNHTQVERARHAENNLRAALEGK